MRLYRRKKGFFYYFSRLLRLSVAAVVCWYAAETLLEKKINTEKIYQESAFKNKKMNVQVKEIEYKNLKAYLFEEHSNPIIAVDFLFRHTGYAYDKKGKFGLALLTAKMLTNGAGEYDETQFASVLEENGIKMGFDVNVDDFGGSLVTTTANADMAVNLLRKVLYEPKPSEDSLSLIKDKALLALQRQKDHPQGELNLLYKEKIYQEHPYSRNPLGKAEDIKRITIGDIEQFIADNLTSDRLIVAIAGDVNENEAVEMLKNMFADLPEQGLRQSLEKFEVKNDGNIVNAERNMPQSIAKIAANGVYRDDKNFYPLYMANYIFGESGLTSRLSKNIREEKGLTYGVYTYLTIKDSAALIEGGYSVAPEHAKQAADLFKAEWVKMGENGVTEDELRQAKNSLIASINLRYADIDAVASVLLSMQKFNLGLDFLQKRNEYIENVTLNEVNNAAKIYYGSLPDFVTIGSSEEK